MAKIRRASAGDLAAVLDLADRRRADYAVDQPRFWRPAVDARDRQSEFFSALLGDPETAFFVACPSGEVEAFLIARLMPAPPVYDPGGLTCMVDDFVVRDEVAWPGVGLELVAAAKSWAAEHGAVQLVAVTGCRDLSKREALASAGLTAASEWWVGTISV